MFSTSRIEDNTSYIPISISGKAWRSLFLPNQAMPKTAGSWISKDAVRTSIVAAPLPAIFLDAVNVIVNGEAIVQLDSTPKFLCIIEKRDAASPKDIEEFKEAFWTQFPADGNGYR
jgi:hypothetical protein